MKITRRELSEMVAHEVFLRLNELHEANDDDDEKEGGDKKPRKPSTASADTEDPVDNGTPVGPHASTGSPDASTPSVNQDDEPDGPAVDGGAPDPEAVDAEGDAGENAGGAVNDEVSGKTVQGISIEPKSKVLPGAKEVIVAFNESTDTLRILVTATGSVKFFWRGQLHDLP